MISTTDRHWPLLVHIFEGGANQAQLDEWLAKLDTYLAREQKTLTLSVARNLTLWEPAVLRRAAEWMRTNREATRAHSFGFAFVLKSPVGRGMLKALLWLQPLPQPHYVSSSVPEALAWLKERARASGIMLPPLAEVEKIQAS
jgi:hypothetical protein